MRTIDVVRPTKIERVVQECSNIRSFYFKDDTSLAARPGQFVMVWLPGVGEFPMSISLISNAKSASIGVKAIGVGTKVLYECKPGDKLGIRGPYGNPFELDPFRRKKGSRVLLVGGGTGMVPMIVLAKELTRNRVGVKAVVAARRKAELPFLRESKKILGKENVFPTTDDGSFGFKGYAHEQVKELVRDNRFDCILSCGPEKMMLRVLEVASENRVPVQFSLERIMKCGMGICGSCTIGDVVLCRDGPVLNTRELEDVQSEFGSLHRDKTGKLCPI